MANYICDIPAGNSSSEDSWVGYMCVCRGLLLPLPSHHVSLSNPIFKDDFGFEHLRICICDYSLSADLKGKHLFLYFVSLPSMCCIFIF